MNAFVKICLPVAVLAMACTSQTKPGNQTANVSSPVDTLVNKASFQRTIDGKQVSLFTLKNKNGVELLFTNFGARLVVAYVPDRQGHFSDVTLGYKTLDEYLTDNMHLGAFIGRYANRIANGKFKLNGKEYTLPQNNGKNTLHGGINGFDKKIWDAKQSGDTLFMSYTSNDMEEGFPGTMKVNIFYTLNDSNQLVLDMKAVTDKPTVVNLTNHAYFNLKGEGNGDILGHEIMINADRFTPIDSTLIPAGKLAPVEGTPLDFRTPEKIGARIGNMFIQMQYGRGYDHNWVLNKKDDQLSLAARVTDPESGRVLEMWTTQPGIQFYSGNFMNGQSKGKSGKPHGYRMGLALEPQHFPDSPNHKNFPGVVLNPGETYHQVIVYHFLVK